MLCASSETTFYCTAVYFGSIHVRNTRHAILPPLPPMQQHVYSPVLRCGSYFPDRKQLDAFFLRLFPRWILKGENYSFMEEILHFALAGPPNCGKTTLFNRLTGSSLQVGNWPGVTVEKKTGVASFENLRMQFTDLPGICALSPWSPEEKVASDFLHSGEVQGIIAVVDALAPQRGLYLLSQLMELHLPILVILNRTDMAERQGFLAPPLF